MWTLTRHHPHVQVRGQLVGVSSSIVWVPGIEFMSQGFGRGCLHPPSPLTSPLFTMWGVLYFSFITAMWKKVELVSWSSKTSLTGPCEKEAFGLKS